MAAHRIRPPKVDPKLPVISRRGACLSRLSVRRPISILGLERRLATFTIPPILRRLRPL